MTSKHKINNTTTNKNIFLKNKRFARSFEIGKDFLIETLSILQT